VEVLETGAVGETYYIAMDLIDGRNLRQVLGQCAKRKILLPIDFGAFVAHTIAQGLQHAHQARTAAGAPLHIVHCDVNPANVFISRAGEIKLGDFGIAQAEIPRDAVPGSGAWGKVRYLAPEQIRGERATPATDLFALGSILFEILTNAYAFPGSDVNTVGQRILAGEVSAPSTLRADVPAALDAIVLRALAPAAQERFANAGELADALASAYNPAIGEPLAIAAVIRGLFGSESV
jgi:serine/threonine protein kinase